MEQPLIESERVHEGLERRSRRTFRGDAVDLSINVFVPIIGRADPRFHAHVPCVDEHRRNISDPNVAELSDVTRDLELHDALQASVEGRVDPAGLYVLIREQCVDEMRRLPWHREL